MGCLRLFAFCVLGCLVFLGAANAQKEAEPGDSEPPVAKQEGGPSDAAEGVAADGLKDLLLYLKGRFDQARELLRRGEGSASDFFDAALVLATEREEVMAEMHRIKGKMANCQSSEERKALRLEMREAIRAYRRNLSKAFLLFLAAAGVSEEEAKEALYTHPRLAALLSLVQSLSVAQFGGAL